MPHYKESLEFLRRILTFQSSLAEKIFPDFEEQMHDSRIILAEAQEQWQSGVPLFEKRFLPVSASLFREALQDLRAMLPDVSMRISLDRLLSLDLMALANVESVLNDFRADRAACIRRLAQAASAEPDILAFLLHTVLSPFFERQAGFYREWIDPSFWQRGKCPMCGSEPIMARLAYDDGRRILVCALCHTEWAFGRLLCPFCESEEQPLVRHFTHGDDKIHRVDCCDKCLRYLKTVDERLSGHPANMPVEDVITAHLDVLAREQGYR